MESKEMFKLIKELEKSFIPNEQIEILRELMLLLFDGVLLKHAQIVTYPHANDPHLFAFIQVEKVLMIEKLGESSLITFKPEFDRKPVEVTADFDELIEIFNVVRLLLLNNDLLVDIDLLRRFDRRHRQVWLRNGTIVIIKKEYRKAFEQLMKPYEFGPGDMGPDEEDDDAY